MKQNHGKIVTLIILLILLVRWIVSEVFFRKTDYFPVSLPERIPWRYITITSAKNLCKSVGVGYDLISNPEWMTVARNIENVDENWTLGQVGSGKIFAGNIGENLADSYNGADPEGGTGRNTKARLFLSNGEEIWDLNGNIHEWVDWTIGGDLERAPTCAAGWREILDHGCAGVTDSDVLPSNSNYNSENGTGQFHGGTVGDLYRGAHYGYYGGNHQYAGIFLSLWNYSGTYIAIGFRCVYRP
jgi:hypothetical protein